MGECCDVEEIKVEECLSRNRKTYFEHESLKQISFFESSRNINSKGLEPMTFSERLNYRINPLIESKGRVKREKDLAKY